ncbi:hypothetical protein BDZ94DRAFT_1267519 [Collybia nuda]|uniref:Uncharacterized protein n=1 Tax=Collybia nuda TaxID=64659 RepID=A0A9P5XZU3_9AGAR|nr:hypothetical protein BDZ94DRAFT_1267519 [Collybia nuda]
MPSHPVHRSHLNYLHRIINFSICIFSISTGVMCATFGLFVGIFILRCVHKS